MKTRKLLYSILLFLFTTNFNFIKAQEENLLTDVDITIYASEFEQAKITLKTFIEKTSTKVLNETETIKRLYEVFNLKEKDFKSLEELLPTMGFISEKQISTTNNTEKVAKLKLEIKYLEQKKTAYEVELKNMTKKNDRYYSYWEEIRRIERRIFDLKIRERNFMEKYYYKIRISIYNDVEDFTSDKVSFVNMPGVSITNLWIENPKYGISAEQYRGFALKYLFTRGKSYVNISALKEYDSKEEKDTSRFSEIFTLGFGQDFYPRHFGRGKNKFLNLYTGYQLGGMFATGDNRKNTIFFLATYLGVEIFKNKYVLIDTRGGYFIPLAYNRNLRGFSASFSFSFVF